MNRKRSANSRRGSNQAGAPPPGAAGYFGLTTDMVQVSNPGGGTDDNRLVVLIANYPYTMLSPYIGGTHMGPNILIGFPLGQ